MIPINIDLSDTVEEFTLSQSETDDLRRYVLDRIMTDFVMRWEDEIAKNLHSTRNEYKRGIFQEQSDDFSVTIGLTPRQSRLAMMIEDGESQFDIKQGFQQSDKRKMTKSGGWYLTVPFRYATSEAVAESGFTMNMPKPVERLAKQGPVQLDNLPEALRGLGQNRTSGYKHKFNIYEGLSRVEAGSGNKEKRGIYMNFRRVSNNSDPSAWIHPGLEARDLMGKALEATDIGNVVDQAVDEFLSNR
jgi:hypothetical protein